MLTSCISYRDVPVDYDYSYQGNFKKYKTFDIMQSLDYADSSMLNESIEKAILARMKFLGYKKTSSRPHLIVSYKMYADSLKFLGYEQPDIEKWIKYRRDLGYDKRKYNMKSGTLLIQFYDRRLNRSVWQGYATTLYGSIDFGNNRHLKNAVISILDKYRFWAEDFIEQQALKEKQRLEEVSE
ncbi:MAG TPA: hypothetical protein DGG95_06075 [Cytophagales bacterium]|nr:hypothetical protein [Cytophagales bacterium]